MAFDQTLEVEQIDKIGSSLKVRYVTSKGQMIIAYTHDRSFKDMNDWSLRACEAAGNEWSDCLDHIFQR